MVLLVVSFTSGASRAEVNMGYFGRQKDSRCKKTKLALKSCEKPRDKVRDARPEV